MCIGLYVYKCLKKLTTDLYQLIKTDLDSPYTWKYHQIDYHLFEGTRIRINL